METTLQEINWIGVYFGLILLGGLIFFIAYLESKSKVKDLYYEKHRILSGYAILIFILISVLLWVAKINNIFSGYMQIGPLLLVVKLIISFFVAGEANKLGRNKNLWGFLAFLEFHIALIALGLGPKLLKVTKDTRNQIINLNNETLEKENALSQALKLGIIDATQNEEKLKEIKSNYDIELSNILKIKIDNNYNTHLDAALKNGIITIEEYESKKRENIKS